jgi:SAM-dependent methyltransferase
MSRRELLIGCGSRRHRADWTRPLGETFENLTTLDIRTDCGADVVHDLEVFPYPFEADSFDEVHAYEVLEHTGRQGDFRFFFRQFEDFWRILKPGGYLLGTSPARTSAWAWGDPGHTRLIQAESLVFLSQAEYVRQAGRTPMTDYRWCYHGDFDVAHNVTDDGVFQFGLRAVKPARI